jgi:bacterioferritin (cytochrome b1)
MESIDDIFSLFSTERRRFALYYLKNAEKPVSIDELAEKICEWEENGSRDTIPDDELREVIISLEHTHLPKMKDATHVEYDRTDGRIRISGLTAEADVILSVSEAIERPSQTNDFVVSRLDRLS